MNNIASYSVGVFIIVLIAGCVVNLLKNHFIIQLSGIAFFFLSAAFRVYDSVGEYSDISPIEVYSLLLPMLSGISACLISMVLGFWIFPTIRKRFRE